jgi:hypothetical protein
MNNGVRGYFSRAEYRWPNGYSRAAAMFAITPEELTTRTGVAFESGVDDLDYFRAVGLELSSGRHVLLLWHERTPVLGLQLDIDLEDDPDNARAETMKALGISAAEVIWQPNSDEESS